MRDMLEQAVSSYRFTFGHRLTTVSVSATRLLLLEKVQEDNPKVAEAILRNLFLKKGMRSRVSYPSVTDAFSGKIPTCENSLIGNILPPPVKKTLEVISKPMLEAVMKDITVAATGEIADFPSKKCMRDACQATLNAEMATLRANSKASLDWAIEFVPV